MASPVSKAEISTPRELERVSGLCRIDANTASASHGVRLVAKMGAGRQAQRGGRAGHEKETRGNIAEGWHNSNQARENVRKGKAQMQA